MNLIIDLQSELLVDRSRVCDPHVRLLLRTFGRELAKGSAWAVVSKEVAAYYGLARRLIAARGNMVDA